MESTGNMLIKETFCKALRMLKEQDSINDEVSRALSKVADICILGCENKWLAALRMVLKEATNDKYDYIDWWLYEATDEYRVSLSDGSKSWYLKEPEALYDYIINECQQ